MKHSTLLNLRKSEHDQKRNNDIKNSHFFKKPEDDDEFENELKKDIFKELEHVKTDNFYVEPIVPDAETIKQKKQDDEFFKLAVKFSDTDSATIEQKRQENIIDLFHYLEDEKS